MATFQVGATLLTFRLLLDGAELAQPPALSVRHIPGGNISNVDFGGLEAPSLKGRVQLTSFLDLRTLQGIQGQAGTLTYSEGTFTATLRSCARTKALGRNDVQFATLDFLLDV